MAEPDGDDIDAKLDRWLTEGTSAEAASDDRLLDEFRARLKTVLDEELDNYKAKLQTAHEDAMQQQLRTFSKNFSNVLETVLVGASERAFRKVKTTLESRGVLSAVSEEGVGEPGSK